MLLDALETEAVYSLGYDSPLLGQLGSHSAHRYYNVISSKTPGVFLMFSECVPITDGDTETQMRKVACSL